MANYTVKTTELGDDCTFHVAFTQAFCDALKANDSIAISYTATVNNQAVIGGNGNDNESKLTYGENGQFTDCARSRPRPIPGNLAYSSMN